ncbi:MAG: glutathione S-transferase N-terminal domain-containing protein [Halobacteria archaeon]|nr:glutathione S-transferase N-terminal domain-containing protein [Halobacteria archaeon]
MLELYQTEGCGYSEKVRKKMSQLGITYVIHNPRLTGANDREVTNEQTYEQMLEIGGEDQVPFLVDHHRGVTMYESDDIIEYLNEHYG